MKLFTLITVLLLFVSFTAAQTSSQIQIDVKNTEPTPLQTSEYADIWLEVTNNGSAAAQNINISFQENYPFSVDRGDRTNWSINELIPGERRQIHLEVRVDDNAVSGSNTLDFRVESGDFGFQEQVPVQVRTDRNVLAVEDINFPENAAPGSSNQMQIELRNLADSQMKNIQVGLDLSGDLPMATSDSSQKNLAAIEPGETEEINYTLNIDSSAENAVYKLPINIGFENEAGTEFNQATTTGVNVGGEPNLQAALDTEDPVTRGTQELTFRLVNQGHGSAEFVSMNLQETDAVEVIGSNQVYIGSMDSDDFQTASFQVYVDPETESVNINELNFPVEISYNSDGQQTETQEVAAEFYTQNQLKQYGVSSSGNPLPLIILALLLIGGGVYYWRKKRNKE